MVKILGRWRDWAWQLVHELSYKNKSNMGTEDTPMFKLVNA